MFQKALFENLEALRVAMRACRPDLPKNAWAHCLVVGPPENVNASRITKTKFGDRRPTRSSHITLLLAQEASRGRVLDC